MNIDVTNYQAWFNVETIHGDRLEFVLADRAEKNTFERSFYVDHLFDKLDDSFGRPGVVMESLVCGDISFLVTADTSQALQDCLEVCDTVVSHWKYQFGIERMKSTD